MEAVLAALFGLLIGSFLNVCIYRLPRDLSVIRPSRSFCPACEAQIAWYDNIPLVSWMALGARCRQCRAPISWRYPVVELLTGTAFCVCFLIAGSTALAIKLCVFSAIQIALIFSDLEERILPDEFTLGGILVGIVFAWFVLMPSSLIFLLLPYSWDRHITSVMESAFSAGFTSFALWSFGALYQRLRHREGLGLGDVKMVGMFGAFFGIQGALLFMIAGSVLGSVSGLLYIFLAKKDASTYELPFGSFLGLSALLLSLYTRGLTR